MDMQHTVSIKAGEAFGSGEHPSSQMALQWLRALVELRPERILDMGCGSGVLAVMAARIYEVPVLAVDIVPEAVACTQENAEANGVGGLVDAVQSDGYQHPKITAQAPYDLVLCNILADHIIRYARDLSAVTREGSYVVLSGVLTWRLQEVTAVHEQLGFAIVESAQYDNWTSLLISKLPEKS